MDELLQIFNRQRKYIFYLLSIYVLCWGVTPYPSIFLSLFIGTALSLFSHWVLTKRMIKFGDAIQEGKKVRSLGTLSRLAVAALATLIATRYPEKLHLVSVVLGLMTSYFVIMIDYVIQYFKQNK
jgi:ATP synthase protein I